MRIATSAFFCFPFRWNIFLHPLTFSLSVSLGLKWVSCRQHIYGSCFCIHSASLCLLVGAFNPFIFKVITDKYDPIAIYFIVLGSSLYTLFVLLVSSFLLIRFSFFLSDSFISIILSCTSLILSSASITLLFV